jgi:chromosome segregation ATPase
METKPTIETVLERLSAMESRSAARESQIISRLEALETQVSGFGARLDALETQVSGFGARLDALEVRVSGVESRLDALETQLKEGFQKVNDGLEIMKYKLEIMTQDIMDVRAAMRKLDRRIPGGLEPSIA